MLWILIFIFTVACLSQGLAFLADLPSDGFHFLSPRLVLLWPGNGVCQLETELETEYKKCFIHFYLNILIFHYFVECSM